MAEVKWQARRVSDGVLVDVTGDTTGTPAGAPTANALEGATNPDGFVNDATASFGFNSLTASGPNATNALLATGTEAVNLLRTDHADGYNHLWVRGVNGQNTLSANNDGGGAAGIPLHLRRIGTGPSGEASILVGNVDPSAGGGVASAYLGSLYIRVDVPQLWIKTSAPNTGWTRLATV